MNKFAFHAEARRNRQRGDEPLQRVSRQQDPRPDPRRVQEGNRERERIRRLQARDVYLAVKSRVLARTLDAADRAGERIMSVDLSFVGMVFALVASALTYIFTGVELVPSDSDDDESTDYPPDKQQQQ